MFTDKEQLTIIKVDNGYVLKHEQGATYVFGSFKELVEHLEETISLVE